MLYDNIRKLADTRHLSIRAIEKNLNFSNGTISKWNESSPSVAKIMQVAKILNVDVNDLLTDSER